MCFLSGVFFVETPPRVLFTREIPRVLFTATFPRVFSRASRSLEKNFSFLQRRKVASLPAFSRVLFRPPRAERSRQRPHRGESTGSRQITAVKRRRAPPVPGWVTAREPGVALASFLSLRVRGPVWAPFFITRYQGALSGSLFCHSISGGPVGLPFLSLVIRGPGRAPFFVTRNRPSLSLSVFEPRPPVPGVPLSS